MKITFLGTGTSTGTPLIGCDCEVCQSSNPKDHRLRSSAFVQVDGLNILIDIGPDFRQQMLRAKVKRIDAVLITHEHNDHIIGLDEIRAFNFLQKSSIPIYAAGRVLKEVKQRFHYLFREELYPGAPRVDVHQIDKDVPFYLQNLKITPIEYLHGRLPVLGFRIHDFAYLTDFKSITAIEFQKLKGIKTLVLSALQRRSHHSHLTLEEALAMAEKIGAKQTFFIHMGHRMGLHEEVQAILPNGVQLAYDGLVLESRDLLVK
ncbi:MAG: MBL fold metallo-hydrolase [Bacteroidota bacterium]